MRYSIMVGPNGTCMSEEEFDKKYRGWPVAYHGTKSGAVPAILNSHIKRSGSVTKDHDRDGYGLKCAYFSPSIVYSSHPTYAAWYNENGKEAHVHNGNPWADWAVDGPGTKTQFILQCRVNPDHIPKKTSGELMLEASTSTPSIAPGNQKMQIRAQTMMSEDESKKGPIDQHFSNDAIEWCITPPNGKDYLTDDQVVCTGIMIRCVDASELTHFIKNVSGHYRQPVPTPLPGNRW